MLDICCPGLYPGVLLWPICHPTSLNNLKAWPRSVWSWRMGLMARLSQLFSQIRFGPPLLWKHGFCLPPWSSSIRWAIPCSHVRVFARRLGRWVRFLLIAVTSGVLRTWIVPGPLCPGPWSEKAARPMTHNSKHALRRDADIPHAAVPSGSFPGWVRGTSERLPSRIQTRSQGAQ